MTMNLMTPIFNWLNFLIDRSMTSLPLKHGQGHTLLIKSCLVAKLSAVSWNWLRYPSKSSEAAGDFQTLIEAVES